MKFDTFIDCNPNVTLINDLELLNQGFKFETGELNWYLDEVDVSDDLKDKLKMAKEKFGI